MSLHREAVCVIMSSPPEVFAAAFSASAFAFCSSLSNDCLQVTTAKETRQWKRLHT